MFRFEAATIAWSSMESHTSEQSWDDWASLQNWQPLAPTQELRHRRGDEMLFLGNGSVSVKYTEVFHENQLLKPNWKLHLGFN